jgi:two-component system OmpR family sensor kinase
VLSTPWRRIRARRSRLSLRGRVLVAGLAMVLVGLVAADVATFAALRSFLYSEADSRLADAVDTVAHAVHADGQVDDDDLVAAEQGGLIAPGMYAERRAPDGSVMIFGGTARVAPRLPEPLPVPPGAPGTTRSAGHAEVAHLTFRSPSTVADQGDALVRVQRSAEGGSVIVVAMALDGVDRTLARLALIEAVVGVVVLGAVAVVGSRLVRIGLSPLDDIGHTAAAISGGDMSRRVERTDDATEVGRLGRAINDMLQRIEVALTEEQEAQDRLRRFVADASHELRTPLAAVEAYAELARRAADAHPEDLDRVLDGIGRESRRMGGLVGDLLLLSRLDQGRPLEQAPVDLGLVVSESADAFRAVAPDRPFRVLTGDLVEVAGDRDRLRQVIDNLLANARQHTPPGTPVDIDVGATTRTAVVHVVDHGPGITPSDSSRVFERFTRLDPSRARTGTGTGAGLGLAIVRAIVDAHDGTVAVAPTNGGGATFTVTLPLLPAGPCPAAHPIT